jgi:hypothetical protein
MNRLPLILVPALLSALGTLGCSRPPTQDEISARAAELLAQQLASAETEAEKLKIADTKSALGSLIIPRVSLINVGPTTCLEFLMQKSDSIAAEGPAEMTARFKKIHFLLQWNPPSNHALSNYANVNLDALNVSLKSALGEVCKQAGLEMEIQPDKVLIYSRD